MFFDAEKDWGLVANSENPQAEPTSAENPLRLEGRNRDDEDSVVTTIGEVSPAHEKREEFRLPRLRPCVGGDLALECEQPLGSRVVDLEVGELHLKGSPAAIGELDDKIDLEVLLVTVVTDLVGGTGHDGEVDAQVSQAECLKEPAQRLRVAQEGRRRGADQGGGKRGIDEVPLRPHADAALCTQGRLSATQVLGQIKI